MQAAAETASRVRGKATHPTRWHGTCFSDGLFHLSNPLYPFSDGLIPQGYLPCALTKPYNAAFSRFPRRFMNWTYLFNAVPKFAEAAKLTLELSLYGIALSLLFGLAVAVVTAYKIRPLYAPARAYIELSRNTPLLIQLFFLYYGLPKAGIKWDGFTCGVIALAFLGASYMAEALRAGILAVPQGQIEAGKAVGLSRWQVFRYVELPQAWAVALPAVGANVLFLIKETSVVSAVGVAELLFVTKDIIGMDYKTNEALLLLFAAYLVILLPLSLLARWAENRVRSAKYGA